MAVQKAPRCVPIDNSIRSREIDQVPYRSRVIFTAAARPCVVVEATPAASPSVTAEEPAVRPLIAAGLEPRFKPADAALEASSSGPQSRWAWFGRAVMAVQKAPRCVPIDNMQQSAVVTPASLQLTTGLLALGPMHRPAMQQPALSPPSSPQPTSEVDTQLHGAAEDATLPRHLDAGQRTLRASSCPADGPVEPVIPPPWAEGQADGTKGASSSTPSSPAKGDSPGAAVIQGATSPSTPVSTTSSPSPAWSPPPSASPSPVSTLQQPPPTVPPPVVQPTVRRSGRYALAVDGAGPTDEDTMQRAMRRKAEKNLDTAGLLVAKVIPLLRNGYLTSECDVQTGFTWTKTCGMEYPNSTARRYSFIT
ncbi:hypothetical protein QYE76_026146 [Lolium multiflorum]|uniref:Uncharacterized protein n=1 Tax=Lolium multiflorum TaxID=4521 RepID=A0AAD8VVB2_LOLMU|nr:hypothetical protein QYE76_026146 [Lolium multiflorum]